jgi:hypothetical protein
LGVQCWTEAISIIHRGVHIVTRRQILQTIKPRTSVVCSLLISLIVQSLATLITNHHKIIKFPEDWTMVFHVFSTYLKLQFYSLTRSRRLLQWNRGDMVKERWCRILMAWHRGAAASSVLMSTERKKKF